MEGRQVLTLPPVTDVLTFPGMAEGLISALVSAEGLCKQWSSLLLASELLYFLSNCLN